MSGEPQGALRYAGLKPRFFALVIDFVLLSLVFFPVTKLVKGVWVMSSGGHAWSYGWFITDPLCLAFLAIILLYFVLLEGLMAGTVGKRLMHLRVVRVDGSPVGLGQSLVRNLIRAVDALPAFNILGVVLIATSREKARAGDCIAGTRVVFHK